MGTGSDSIHRIYLALGSSLGNRLENLRFAVDELHEMEKTSVVRVSPVYETPPAGGVAKKDFYNACMEVETAFLPEQLLEVCLYIESAAGRMRENPLDDRTLDIDILFYDDLIIDEYDLVIPHPQLTERKFVLQPLFDIAPDFVDPKSGLEIRRLLVQCPDQSDVRQLPDRLGP